MFEYLDHLPKIPEHLIAQVYECLESDNLFSNKKIHGKYGTYAITNDLADWLSTFFSREYMFKVQRVENGLHAHIDKSRLEAFNYLIDTGGPEAALCYYDNLGNITAQFQIEAHRWHRIDVTHLHTVKHIKTTRIAITVFKPLD
jgi:hypothetical protein